MSCTTAAECDMCGTREGFEGGENPACFSNEDAGRIVITTSISNAWIEVGAWM